jgi:hypothetical protein
MYYFILFDGLLSRAPAIVTILISRTTLFSFFIPARFSAGLPVKPVAGRITKHIITFGTSQIALGWRHKGPEYCCPLACGKKGFTRIDKYAESDYINVVKMKLKDDYRSSIQVPRHTN